MTRWPGRSNRLGFTLIETLVTIAVIGVLATVIILLISYGRNKARAYTCLSNQEQISDALTTYYMDKGRFPTDSPISDMALQLSAYIPWEASDHTNGLPPVYRCPNDRSDARTNSYQPYYVQRKEPTGAEYFVLGCPRHTDAEDCYINLFGTSYASRSKPGVVKINGQAVSAEAPDSQRTMRSGKMTFEDGSSVSITSTSPAYEVTAVASFRQSDGRLYSIVRVQDRGSANFTITPGSRFEVITPVGLIGVRGTQFTVETDKAYAKTTLTKGKIVLWNKVNQQEQAIQDSGVVEIGTSSLPQCIQCPPHCVNGKHCERCALHVGNPQNIGTTSCVACPKHCKTTPNSKNGSQDHCLFCPLKKN